MPELPEVETIRTEISPSIIGRRIDGVQVFWERMVREPSLDEFRRGVTGQRIVGVDRRGKYLLIRLGSGYTLVVHLKMSGALIVGKPEDEPPRYTHAIIDLDGRVRIFFRDPRKFGLMRLAKDDASVVGRLGPEPLEPGFTPDVLGKLLAGRKAPIKALLTDQDLLAGVGNMYADEALYEARIHPLRTGGSLSKAEIARLHKAVLKVLVAGIGNKGASIENYLRPDGSKGTAHNEFKVAHQRKATCPHCGTPIQRIAVRNRGTYFCPKCQKMK